MADLEQAFEQTDKAGTTQHFNGTAGTTAVNLPNIPGNVISEFFLRVPRQSGFGANDYVEISLDNGAAYTRFYRGDGIGFSVKGDITQLKVRSSKNSGAEYQLILNFEDY